MQIKELLVARHTDLLLTYTPEHNSGHSAITGNLVSKSYRKAMNRNWNNQKAYPALKTKAGKK